MAIVDPGSRTERDKIRARVTAAREARSVALRADDDLARRKRVIKLIDE